jgi:hypothetical protein
MRAIYYAPQDSAFVVLDNDQLVGFAAPGFMVEAFAALGLQTPKEMVLDIVANDTEDSVRLHYGTELITLADLDPDKVEWL